MSSKLPPKKEVMLALLESTSVFIHLDPRRAQVAVPKWLTNQPQLVLQVGLNMAVPIRDLNVDDECVSCTLSFNRSPFFCWIPWTAIFALIGEDGRAMVWPNDVPAELAAQAQQAAAKQKGEVTPAGGASPRRLRAVAGGGEPDVAVEAPAAPEVAPVGPVEDAVPDGDGGAVAEAPAAESRAEAAEETSEAGTTERRPRPSWLRVVK